MEYNCDMMIRHNKMHWWIIHTKEEFIRKNPNFRQMIAWNENEKNMQFTQEEILKKNSLWKQ